jgi:hypothetical protein
MELAEMARRYVSGHGPAQAQDLAWWSGLTVLDAKRGLEASGDALERADLEGKTYYLPPGEPTQRTRGPSVHLLPNYDELFIAFKDRSAMFEPHVRPERGVLSAHFVAVNGRIVGSWRRKIVKSEVMIEAQVLRALTSAERAGLERALSGMQRAWGWGFGSSSRALAENSPARVQ